MNDYIKQFRPLTSDDVEFIRKKQGGIKDICVMLQEEFVSDETINLVAVMMPQLNISVKGYYIDSSLYNKPELPHLMTKEVFDAYYNTYMDAAKTKADTSEVKSDDYDEFIKFTDQLNEEPEEPQMCKCEHPIFLNGVCEKCGGFED